MSAGPGGRIVNARIARRGRLALGIAAVAVSHAGAGGGPRTSWAKPASRAPGRRSSTRSSRDGRGSTARGWRAAEIFRPPTRASTIPRPARRSSTSRSVRSRARCGVKDRAVDFGASDMPLKSDGVGERWASASSRSSSAASSWRSTSMASAPAQLKLTGPLLADVFLGKITPWSDRRDHGAQSGADAPRRRASPSSTARTAPARRSTSPTTCRRSALNGS